MADETDKPLADRILGRVFDHEGRIATVESAVGEIKGSLALGTDKMHSTERRVDAVEANMRAWGEKTLAANEASNERAIAENKASNDRVERKLESQAADLRAELQARPVPRPLHWAVKWAAGIGLSILGAAASAGVGIVWQQQIRQEGAAKDMEQVKEALKSLDQTIRGATPGKATP